MSADATESELMPRELGLLAGHAWGLAAGTTPVAHAKVGEPALLTRAALDVPFRMGVAAKLAEFPDVAAAENEFWQSFRHGFELSSSRTWRESSPGADLGGAGVGVPVRR